MLFSAHIRPITCFLVLLALMSCRHTDSRFLTGEVVGVTDGDTVTLLTKDKEEVKIRLAEIDAPERSQPYGKASKQVLSDLVFRKEVRIKKIDVDRYGRTVGRIYAGKLDISAEMVRAGAAWVYIKYSKDARLIPLEAEARMSKKGLWALPEEQIQAPWEWRKRKK